MIGALALLPMLDVGRLLTGSEADRKAIARTESGTVIHAIGHFLAAAKLGVLTDFVMFNWSVASSRKHAVYTHERSLRRSGPTDAGTLACWLRATQRKCASLASAS